MELSEESFTIYAGRCYDFDRSASVDEFYDDLNRIKYVKRLLSRYHRKGELKARLLLNHIIVIYNCFGPSATEMLFMRTEGLHHYLKPFVLFLNYLPDTVKYDGKIIHTVNIPMDMGIVQELRKI